MRGAERYSYICCWNARKEWADDIMVFHAELHVIRSMLSADEPLQSVGAVSALDSTEDVSLRAKVIDDMAGCAQQTFGQEDVTANNNEEDHPRGARLCQQKTKTATGARFCQFDASRGGVRLCQLQACNETASSPSGPS